MALEDEKPRVKKWPFFDEEPAEAEKPAMDLSPEADDDPAEKDLPEADLSSGAEEEPAGEVAEPVSFENKRVLIADDSTVMRKIIKNSLNQLGFSDYVEAADGHAAMKEVGEDPVDLIISDWNMPKMTGLEFLKTVRAHGNLKDIPFLMVTSEGDQAKIIEAVQAGVSQYIVKPFNAEQLQEKVKQILTE